MQLISKSFSIHFSLFLKRIVIEFFLKKQAVLKLQVFILPFGFLMRNFNLLKFFLLLNNFLVESCHCIFEHSILVIGGSFFWRGLFAHHLLLIMRLQENLRNHVNVVIEFLKQFLNFISVFVRKPPFE
jgi:hypothetical protein